MDVGIQVEGLTKSLDFQRPTLRPLFDDELRPALDATAGFLSVNASTLEPLRQGCSAAATAAKETADRLGVAHTQRTIEGPGGSIELSIFRPADTDARAPAMYTLHGGGMVMGDRFFFFQEAGHLQWAREFGAVVISAEYRLAPEFPAPAGVEDCYAGFEWVVANSDELEIDPDRLIIAGVSGGGGLAAGVSLLSRDRQGPRPLAQMLICPMLDDRLETLSASQFRDTDGVGGACSAESAAFLWDCVLGAGHQGREVDHHVVPGRATDLSGLPPAFIDVGSAEVFRDESVAYASRLWASGVRAELHVWGGAFHTSDIMVPTAAVSVAAHATRADWLRRTWMG